MKKYKTSLSSYDLPPLRNRQVYAAAKKPFEFAWKALCWLSVPWLAAMLITFSIAAAIAVYQLFLAPTGAPPGSLLMGVGLAALEWGGYLGGVLLVVSAPSRLRNV